jgi:hypothetical protein
LLELMARQPAYMHELVKGMPMVIKAFAFGAKLGQKIRSIERWSSLWPVQIMTSMPS